MHGKHLFIYYLFIYLFIYLLNFIVCFLGRVSIDTLFNRSSILKNDAAKANTYIELLQKFEVALRVNKSYVLIPSLMPTEAVYPKLDDSLKGLSLSKGHVDSFIPPLRRFWFSNYVPEGFWPRLICRIINDPQIRSILVQYIKSDNYEHMEWVPWRTGLAFTSCGRTLLLVQLKDNKKTDWDYDGIKIKSSGGSYRIEVHIYIPEMLRIVAQLQELGKVYRDNSGQEYHPVPHNVAGHATQIIVTIGSYIVDLASWFVGMLVPDKSDTNNSGYVPCWMCYGHVEENEDVPVEDDYSKYTFIDVEGEAAYYLALQNCIVPACQQEDHHCPAHGKLRTIHIAPDLVSTMMRYHGIIFLQHNVTLME